MERIRKALDLARMERYRLLGPRDLLKSAAETPRPVEMLRPAEAIRPVKILRATETASSVEILKPIESVSQVETFTDAAVPIPVESRPPAKIVSRVEACGPAETTKPVESVDTVEVAHTVETVYTVETFDTLETFDEVNAVDAVEILRSAQIIEPVEVLRTIQTVGPDAALRGAEITVPIEILRPLETFRSAEATSWVEAHGLAEITRPIEARRPAPTSRPAVTLDPDDILGCMEAPGPTVNTTRPARPADSPRSAEPKISVSPVPISYSRTKTFSPSPQLLEANRILEPSGASPAVAAFRMLRTQVLQRMKEHQWRSLAVLSPNSEDGKTTTAINLAVTLANDHQHTVLLVEFDLKRPRIADILGISPEMGADDLLRGTARLEDCLYHPEGFDRLVVLPARAAMELSSEVLAGPWCREIVMQLRTRYPDRLLVFDLPPVLGADDALAFLPLVECALVVVSEGSTRRDDLVTCMELLRKTPVVGTVLNRATHVALPYGR